MLQSSKSGRSGNVEYRVAGPAPDKVADALLVVLGAEWRCVTDRLLWLRQVAGLKLRQGGSLKKKGDELPAAYDGADIWHRYNCATASGVSCLLAATGEALADRCTANATTTAAFTFSMRRDWAGNWLNQRTRECDGVRR
jgi:hypothetical protein